MPHASYLPMDDLSTEPRDLRPRTETDASLRRDRAPIESQSPSRVEAKDDHSRGEREDAATRSSRVYFFVMAAIIALAIAVFLILHPQAGD